MEELKEPADVSDADNSSNDTNETSLETSSQAEWTEGLPQETLKMVADKGWKSPQDVLKSYQSLEKSTGNKFSIPKADDADGWKKLDAKLGCPETIEGYALKDVVEADIPFIDDFKSAALETGLRPAQVEKIYNWYKARQDKLTQDFNALVEKDKEAIKAEWGDDYSKNEELMKRGVRVLELPEEMLTNIEVSIGTKAFMQMAKRLGEAVSEDTVKGLGGGATQTQEVSTQEWIQSILNKARGE
ncbi:MAG: hypothetical protein IJ184_07240 [Alphaproteobacteria bacterium]|nr:hypothetical protein [Alphaproteobacteria bacterium]